MLAGATSCGENNPPTPPCIEITPPADLEPTVTDVIENGVDFWETKGVTLTLDHPRYFQKSDSPCRLSGSEILRGTSFFNRHLGQISIRKTSKVTHKKPVETQVVIAHEVGHAVQARKGQTYHPKDDNERRDLKILKEAGADCYAGMLVADRYPDDKQAAAEFTGDHGDDTHSTGSTRKRAFLIGAQEGAKQDVCSYTALSDKLDIPLPGDSQPTVGQADL